MRELIVSVLSRVGLARPARDLWKQLKASGWTPWKPLVPEDAFTQCIDHSIAKLLASEPSEEFGCYLEFGVSRGTSLACVYDCLNRAGLKHIQLFGFDSFEGMPPEAAQEGWLPGQFYSTLNATKTYLNSRSVDLSKITLIKGWFDQTLNDSTRCSFAIGKASLIMIDCDIYSASRLALNFSAKYIGNHAILIFDDWGWREDVGEIGQKEAFSEFLSENPDISAESLPAYLPQAKVFFLTRAKRQS